MNVFTILFDHLLITLLICCWSGKSVHDYKNYKDVVSSSTVRSINAVNCMDTVIVDREGSFGAGSSRQVIVPQSNFFCNGRLTGFVVSLYDYENDNQFLPHIQVWRRSRNSSSLYKLIGQVQPKDDEIIQRRGYFLANVTLSVNDRIQFQPGDAIGYYHPPSPRYRVGNTNVDGYTTLIINAQSPLSSFNIEDADDVDNNRRPLIETRYGK